MQAVPQNKYLLFRFLYPIIQIITTEDKLRLDPNLKTARQLIGKLIDLGMTRTQIAEKSGTSVSTISRTYTGEYADLDYEVGKRLESVIKAFRVRP